MFAYHVLCTGVKIRGGGEGTFPLLQADAQYKVSEGEYTTHSQI